MRAVAPQAVTGQTNLKISELSTVDHFQINAANTTTFEPFAWIHGANESAWNDTVINITFADEDTIATVKNDNNFVFGYFRFALTVLCKCDELIGRQAIHLLCEVRRTA